MGSHKITKILNSNFWTSAGASPSSGARLGAGVSLRLLPPLRRLKSRARLFNSARTSILAPALALAIAVLGISFFSQTAYAASYINVSSGSGGTVSLGSIKPSATGVSASGSDTLTITTNCSAGYSVYVSAQNGGDTNLTNTNSSVTTNNTISASSTAVGSTATTLNSNTWGITGDSANASASKYVGLPSYADATNTALISNSSASTTGDNKSTVYYGVKVDTTLSPGTYSGDVLYTTLVSDKCNNYTVHFDANGGSGSMSDQTIPVGTATSLTMNVFIRPGYMFLGWGTSSSATELTYKDGEKVTDISGFNTTINLYALWGQSTGNMQDFKCTDLASGTTAYLTDTRDNQVYSVYRIPTDQTYKDSTTVANIAGKCLMTKDLSLGYVTGGSITKGSNLVLSTDTSAGSATSDAPIYYRTTNAWSSDNPNENLQYTNGPRPGYEAYSSHSYYSYGAAQKACPKGWRLPVIEEYSTNGSSSAAKVGLSAIVGNSTDGSKALQSFPWNFMLGGYVWGSISSTGTYWSSTEYSTTPTYGNYLLIGSSSISYSVNPKYGGRSVRCIAEDNYTISYSNTGADSGGASKTSESVYESGSVEMPTVGSMTKSGYEFKGWALTSGATEAVYSAEQTVTISALITAASSAGQTTTAGSTITLYPVWVQSYDGDMQSFDCTSLASGATARLRDTRDDQAYSVYRIPTNQTYAGSSTVANVAGKCIMTKDLNLGAVASVSGASSTIVANGTMTLSPSDSGFTTPTGSGESITVPTSNVTVNMTWGTTEKYSNKSYRANGTGDYTGRGYYSWGAAMVVCPKGWRLPTADEYSSSTSWEGQTAGLAAIVKGANAAATIANITGSPYSFVLGGHSSNGWFNATSYGYYWSSTQDDSSSAHILLVSSSYGLKRDYYGKSHGYSVRCISDPGYTYTLSYSGANLATSNAPTTQTYTGTEDSHTFTIPTTTPASYTPLTFTNYSYNGNTYNPGDTITLASDSPSAELTLNWGRSCSISSSTGCELADNRTWIYGNSGDSTTWDNICTNAQNKNDPTDSSTTYASCSSCPSGYTFPRITDFDKLVQAYGGTSYSKDRSGYQETTGALYKVLGLSSNRNYWSSTEHSSYAAYRYNVSSDRSRSSHVVSSYSHSSYGGNKTNGFYVLCYK